jgi:hypothetical protein
MKCLVHNSVLALAFSLLPLAASPSAQTPASAADAAPRTSLQWTAMKGKRTQIFIDLHAKGQATYRGITEGFAPTLMVQLPGDGSVDLLQYQGSGDDWKWVPMPAHIALTHPDPGTSRVEFDTKALAPGKKFSVIFRSLNEQWTAVASSKVLPWTPN